MMIMLANSLLDAETKHVLKGLLVISVVYVIASFIRFDWLSLLVTAIANFIGYQITKHYQDLWPKMTYLRSQTFIMMPIVVFFTAWFFVLVQIDQGAQELNGAPLNYILCMVTASWPIFIRGRKEPAKPRKWNYKVSYSIAATIGLTLSVVSIL
ncbi:hypothetical protein [Methylophaga sp.]|uniref:hypothetical protein n=1 Tax=Methylophaga sp. TaxID=2024840 RepID=UPI003A91BD05